MHSPPPFIPKLQMVADHLFSHTMPIKKSKKLPMAASPPPPPPAPGPATVGILSFEVANAMSRAIHLHRSLSSPDHDLPSLPLLSSPSPSPSFLLSLARAERLDIVDRIAALAARLGRRHCPHHPPLSSFEHVYSDPNPPSPFLLPHKPFLSLLRRMDRLVSSTASLHSELLSLSDLEHSLTKLPNSPDVLRSYSHKLHWHRRQVDLLRSSSLWSLPFSKVVLMLAQASCTLRSLLLPSSPSSPPSSTPTPSLLFLNCLRSIPAYNHLSLNPSSSPGGTDTLPKNVLTAHASPATLGGCCLAMHYANVIIVIEKLLQYPHLVGDEARGDLYQMLPSTLRSALRRSLRSCAKDLAIYDASLAHDWKLAMEGILAWLAPMAHSMVRWQAERNFEQQQQVVARENVLLLQTLYFADREKTEAAMCELLVGLNYICRYEQQQNALLDCTSSVDFDECVDWQQVQFRTSPERA